MHHPDMCYLTTLKYRTVKDGDEAEGICEMYFKEQKMAIDFALAAKNSEDLESFEVLDCVKGKLIASWEL